jgi:hypothetical protein
MAPSYSLKDVASAARDVSTIIRATKEAVDAGKDLYNAFPGREIMAGGKALYDWAMPRQTAQMGTQMSPAQMTPGPPAPSVATPPSVYGAYFPKDWEQRAQGHPIDGNFSPPPSPVGQERFPSGGLPWVPEDRPYVPAPEKGIAWREDKAFGPYTRPARKKNHRPKRVAAPVPINEDVPMVDAQPPAPVMGDGFMMGTREGGMGGGRLRGTDWIGSGITEREWEANRVQTVPSLPDPFPQYTAQQEHITEIERMRRLKRAIADPYRDPRPEKKPWGFE